MNEFSPGATFEFEILSEVRGFLFSFCATVK